MTDNRQEVGGAVALRLFTDQITRLGWRYGVFALTMVGVGLAALTPARFLQFFTERTLFPGASSQMTALLAFGFAAAGVIWLTGTFARHFQDTFRFQIEGGLRRSIIRRLHQIPLTALDGSARGEWVERVTQDLSAVERFLADGLPRQVRNGALFLGVATLLVLRGGVSSAVALVGAAALAIVQDWLEAKSRPARAKLRADQATSLSMLKETLEGMRTIRSHGAEPFLERRFDAKLAALPVAHSAQTLPQGLLLQVLFTVALTAAAFAVELGRLTPTDALVFPFFLTLLYQAALGLVCAAGEWRAFLQQGTRLGAVVYGNEGLARAEGEIAAASFKHADRLEVRGLTLGDEQGVDAGPFDFSVKRGELWAIVGPPACGKSTLLEVLAGLRPALAGKARVVQKEGEVSWEAQGRNGVWLPVGACAYVEPRPFLFDGTLRENLTFGNTERLSDAVLWDFLERTGLYEFARDRGGLDAPLGDFRRFSESDRFRISLCRALLTKRPFLLLDEPFRGLDDSSIGSIAATLEFQKRYSGVILITQSVPLALSVDGLFSFEKGNDGWQGQADGPEDTATAEAFPRLQASANSAQPAIPNN